MPKASPNIRSVFDRALELTSEAERRAYLDEACAGDPQARAQVEALLRAHAAAGSFLETPASALATSIDELRALQSHPPLLTFLSPSDKAGSLGRLAHYEIQEIVGSGGMGIVLKAIDTKLLRVVAVKVMAESLAASESARKRFMREAQAAAAVRNDHIVCIHAVDEVSGRPYLVMELISGVSLQQRLDQSGPLSVREILRIGMQIAQGLAAAHAQGLVHRDIKPANILLENGVERVKITDFGLARIADDASLTQTSLVAGTPQYMAPEQARGEHVDHRADLFCLGSVLYAMCTGHAPFRASTTLGVIRNVCEAVPRPVRDLNPEIPEWLGQIIDRLLAKEAAKRFQSAQEVAEVLKNHLAQIQQPGLPLVVIKRRKKSPSRRGHSWILSLVMRRWVIGGVAALLVLCTALGLTEASGVTQLAATVIRIFTPDGTLVVETDDPAVKVTIEGDGGLSITGAGPQEVRLRPGKYHVQAAKDGKPFSQKLVEIRRGDRKVVTVTHERFVPSRARAADAPRLLTPTADETLPNGAKSGAVPFAWEFNWSEVQGATSYELYVKRRDPNTRPLFDLETNSTRPRLEHKLPSYVALRDGWYWKVRAKVNGEWGQWSEERPFRVAEAADWQIAEVQDASIPPPTLLTPTPGAVVRNGALDRSQDFGWDFTWSEVAGATRYHHHIICGTAKESEFYRETVVPSARHGFHHTYANPDIDWSWKVRAQVGGKWGPWSETRTFRPAPPQPASADGPFVVLKGNIAAVTARFATLAEAVQNSADGDTIEIRGNGPFVIEPMRITSRRVIRAGRGFRPVLKINSPSVPAPGAPRFLESVAPLVLEGLEFQPASSNVWAAVTTLSPLPSNVARGALYVANCRFTRCNLMPQHVSACQIRNCQVHSRNDSPIGFFLNDSTLSAVIDNNIALPPTNLRAAAVGFFGARTGQRLILTRNLLGGHLALGYGVQGDEASQAAEPISVDSSQNIWFGRGGAVRFHVGSDSTLPTGRTTGAELERLLRQVFDWHEERNLYPEGVSLLSLSHSPAGTYAEPTRPYKTLTEWNQLWSAADTTSIQGAIRCQAGDVWQKLMLKPEEITPEDFRLVADSAGYRAGEGGKDLGPDIDLVGPGEAYERWKKTPDYQEWRKETRQAK